MLFLLVSCSEAGTQTQWDFQRQIISDRQSLFPAAVYTDAPASARVNRSFPLRLRICGPDARCAPPGSQSPDLVEGQPPDPSPHLSVRAGARMRVRLDSTGGAEIISQSAEIQPVVEPSDLATWLWLVRISQPGRHVLSFHIAPLWRESPDPLVPETVVTVAVQVEAATNSAEAPTRDVAASIWSNAVDLADDIGILVGAVLTVSGAVAGLQRRRRRPARDTGQSSDRD
jgi:hypothetical protein